MCSEGFSVVFAVRTLKVTETGQSGLRLSRLDCLLNLLHVSQLTVDPHKKFR